LRAARIVKPNGVYLSDYLTRYRTNIFYKLRQLKKDNVKVKAVFTRNGNLMCKIDAVDKLEIVNCQEDLESLIRKL